MTIINKPPEDVRECVLYRHLLETSTEIDGCAERTNRFIEQAAPLLDLVLSGPFKDYTLHNRDHAKKLIHLAGYVIMPETLSRLSPLECQVLICSAYLHDLGMVLSPVEREKILKSPIFLDEFRDWSQLWYMYQQACRRLDDVIKSKADEKQMAAERLLVETEIFQIHEAALCAFLRPRHAAATRYRQLTAFLKESSNRPDLFELSGLSFEDYLITINASHNQDVGVLAEVYGVHKRRFPTDLVVAGQRLNTQFVAAALRIVDILDFDRERTPRVLYESLGISSLSLPNADITLAEWRKHMSVHDIEITQDEIIVSCECQHPATEKAIRDFCQVIEREIRDTTAVIRQNPSNVAQQYQLQMPISVRPSITSKGYIYKDISLQLNQTAITSLLMGERLYSSPAAAIRELIQNSIDACGARQKIQSTPEPEYKPLIVVSLTSDQKGRHWIEVSDNGIGMDEHVLAEYFLKLGSSYYDSPEFDRIYRQGKADQPFKPIAKFGIGILSVFMIADTLEVTTRCSCSPRSDDKSRLVRIERMGGLAFMAASSREQFGCCVRIRLKPEIDEHYAEFVVQACHYLKEVVVNPGFDVEVRMTENPFTLSCTPRLSLKPGIDVYFFENHLKPVEINLEKWSDRLFGTIVLFFSVNSEGGLSHLSSDNRQLRVAQRSGPNIIDPNTVFDNYRGNRVTVNGFRMILKKMLSIYRRRIAAALDIDFVGDTGIEYEVSRDKIAGLGGMYVRNSIRAATFKALSEMGTLATMVPETRGLITDILIAEKPWARGTEVQHDVPPDILEKVAKMIPQGRWPPMLDKKIARELNISNSLASRAISRLIKQNGIKKPASIPLEKSGNIGPEANL